MTSLLASNIQANLIRVMTEAKRALCLLKAVYFVASTLTRAFGASPNISGAYMASTRDGGSEN